MNHPDSPADSAQTAADTLDFALSDIAGQRGNTAQPREAEFEQAQLEELIEQLPKVVLHDHLDGGLRPETIIELAAECDYTDSLPATDPQQLKQWFIDTGNSGSLPRYLTAFAHTCAVMQTASAITRVAREAVVDLAADNVVYAELRMAPENHLAAGLSLAEVIDAVVLGLAEGEAHAAVSGYDITARMIVCAMRQNDNSLEVARATAAAYGEKSQGYVVGFDIAGPENGFPPSNHEQAFDYLRRNLVPITIHAGEDAGVDSLRDAVAQGTHRLGHGVRVYEDFTASVAGIECGPTAAFIRDRALALELCPSSNVQTGVCAHISEHPFPLLDAMGFHCTVNTDNRLIGDTSMSAEMITLMNEFDYGIADLAELTVRAIRSAFVDIDTRERLEYGLIGPAWAQALGIGD